MPKQKILTALNYDFSLSSRVLKSSFPQPIDIDDLPATTKSKFVVEPGEVVFVLTQETLSMPDNVMALLIQRKLSHDGIMILGGLSIDPLYEGKLLIGLYNLSSSKYPIIPGRKLIAAQFYRLSEDEGKNIVKPDVKIMDFPDELVRLMQNYKPVSSEAIMTNVTNLEARIENLILEFKSKDDWFKNLQTSMEKQEKIVEKILDGLGKEEENRKKADEEIGKKVDSIMKSSIKTGAIVGGIVSIILVVASLVVQTIINKRTQDRTPMQQPTINISLDSVINSQRSITDTTGE